MATRVQIVLWRPYRLTIISINDAMYSLIFDHTKPSPRERYSQGLLLWTITEGLRRPPYRYPLF